MSKYKRMEWQCTLGEVRRGARRYLQTMVKPMEELEELVKLGKTDPQSFAKEMVFMGYAMGVIAGIYSDMGIEGFTLLLNGINLSLVGEDRKEKILYGIYDKNGVLHTSEEGVSTEKGGEP